MRCLTRCCRRQKKQWLQQGGPGGKDWRSRREQERCTYFIRNEAADRAFALTNIYRLSHVSSSQAAAVICALPDQRERSDQPFQHLRIACGRDSSKLSQGTTLCPLLATTQYPCGKPQIPW